MCWPVFIVWVLILYRGTKQCNLIAVEPLAQLRLLSLSITVQALI